MAERTQPKSIQRPTSRTQIWRNNELNDVIVDGNRRQGSSIDDGRRNFAALSSSHTRRSRDDDRRSRDGERRGLIDSLESVPCYNSTNAPRGDQTSQATSSRQSDGHRSVFSIRSDQNSPHDTEGEDLARYLDVQDIEAGEDATASQFTRCAEVLVNTEDEYSRKRFRRIRTHKWKLVFIFLFINFVLALGGFIFSFVNFQRIDQAFLQNCKEIQNDGHHSSGVYKVNINGRKLQVYCDMKTDGGGWMVIQRRVDDSVNFYQSFSVYRDNFGDVEGNYWLGLENINRLTSSRQYEVRIEMEDFEMKTASASYSTFSVGPISINYSLRISGYSGTAGDSLSCDSGSAFSTYDMSESSTCADTHQGGWWYTTNSSSCGCSNLNGHYFKRNENKMSGIWWYSLRGGHQSLKRVEMKIRPN